MTWFGFQFNCEWLKGLVRALSRDSTFSSSFSLGIFIFILLVRAFFTFHCWNISFPCFLSHIISLNISASVLQVESNGSHMLLSIPFHCPLSDRLQLSPPSYSFWSPLLISFSFCPYVYVALLLCLLNLSISLISVFATLIPVARSLLLVYCCRFFGFLSSIWSVFQKRRKESQEIGRASCRERV